LKYQRFAPSGCKDIGISRFEFVAKTQFLLKDFRECRLYIPKFDWFSCIILKDKRREGEG